MEEVVIEVQFIGEVLIGPVPLGTGDEITKSDGGLNSRVGTPRMASWVYILLHLMPKLAKMRSCQ